MYQSDAVTSISDFVACLVFSMQHIYIYGLDTGLLILNVLMLQNKNEKLNIYKIPFQERMSFWPRENSPAFLHQFQAKLHVTNICTDHSLNRLKTDWICLSLLCTGPSRSMMQAENKDKLWKFLFLKLIFLITLSTAVSNTGNITFEIKPWEINNVFTFKNIVHTQNIRKIKVTTFSHQVDGPFYFWTDVFCKAKKMYGHAWYWASLLKPGVIKQHNYS